MSGHLRSLVPTGRPAALGAAAVLLAVGLTACSSSGDQPAPTPSSAPSTSASPVAATYVALGDSYAAAPGLPPPATDGSAAANESTCLRSQSNYPHLIAAADPEITLDDVSCSGATSADVLSKQLPALSSSTRLVTVGVGGNDGDLFANLVLGCTNVAASDRDGSPCTSIGTSVADTALSQTRTNLEQLMSAITKAAPDAQVVVVGYPQLLPSSGSCPDRVGFAAGDYAFVNSVTQRLSQELEAAADDHGATFIDLYSRSKGHDICSAQPWINGMDVASNGVIPYHPLAAEQQAVAALVAAVR